MRHRLNGGPDWMLSPPPPKHRKLSINFLFTFVMCRVGRSVGGSVSRLRFGSSSSSISLAPPSYRCCRRAPSTPKSATTPKARRAPPPPSPCTSSLFSLLQAPPTFMPLLLFALHKQGPSLAFQFRTSPHFDDLQGKVDTFSTSTTNSVPGLSVTL